MLCVDPSKCIMFRAFFYLYALSACLCIPLTTFHPTQRVLLVHSELNDDVKIALNQTGQFAEVSSFHADQGTPSLHLLSTYDVVLVWSLGPFNDSEALGNVLADYWDSGGRVVLAQYTMTPASIFEVSRSSAELWGRFGLQDQGYIFLKSLDDTPEYGRFTLAVPDTSPSHEILDGVDEVGQPGSVHRSATINGGEVVAAWSNGLPLAARGLRGGRCIIALNAFPRSIIGREYDPLEVSGTLSYFSDLILRERCVFMSQVGASAPSVSRGGVRLLQNALLACGEPAAGGLIY